MEPASVDPKSVLLENKDSYTGFPFWKESILVILFLVVAPLTILSSTLALFAITKPVSASSIKSKPVQIYAALPETRPAVSGTVIGEDARAMVLQKFLKLNNSPLLPYANMLVQTADHYGLDWKLIPAIAQKESGLCRVIPEGSHNCWGWGIHSKGTLMFDNYPEAIDTVAKGLKEKYIDMGYTTPEKIMTKYAHPDSTTWADGVSMYMEQIKSLELSD